MSAPILASSCARAATSAEARFRLDAPIAPSRGARVIALDQGAVSIVHLAAAEPWASARFFRCSPDDDPGKIRGMAGDPADLAEQLADADVVVMVATTDAAASWAAAIGRACWKRSIMTAGIVVGDAGAAQRTVAALRPHARVLLPSGDDTDVVELLTALRA